MKQKLLTLDELKSIYAPCLARDFPPDELMPLRRMEALTQSGAQAALGFYDAQGLAAYAVFILAPQTASPTAVLLNYFAVQPQCRGKGTGTACLRQLCSAAQDLGADYVIFEVEDPGRAANAQDRTVRQKRVDFYLRGGAKPTAVRSWLYGVDYQIMTLSVEARSLPDQAVMAALEHLYHTVVPADPGRGRTFSDVCRVWLANP